MMTIEERDGAFWVSGSPSGKLLQICRMEGPFATRAEAEAFVKNPTPGFNDPMSLREQSEALEDATRQMKEQTPCLTT